MEFSLRHMLDKFGATGSLLCAVHCALTPLILAVLPAIGLGIWTHHGVEFILVVFVTLLGLSSLIWGFRRHRALYPLGILIVGLIALWGGMEAPLLHDAVVPHAITMTLGGVCVAVAHILNLRLNRMNCNLQPRADCAQR